MKSSDSVDVAFCLQKIDSVIALIRRLLDGDYPHRDSRLALEKILDVYASERNELLAIDPAAAPETILEFCRSVNVRIVRLKRFLGLLIRSSNLRNAFEIYFPIKILSTELLERNICVVLSSEWEFSPFIYPVALDELPDFVFIGIPASECHNPLIIPLAAHELGHVVWRRKGAEDEFAPKIKDQILKLYRDNWTDFQSAFDTKVAATNIESDLFLLRAWKESYNLAMRQLEEMFCDFMGIFIFGASFFHSFLCRVIQ